MPAARRGWEPRSWRCRRARPGPGLLLLLLPLPPPPLPLRGWRGRKLGWGGELLGASAGRGGGVGMRLGLLTTFVTLRPGWLGFDPPSLPIRTPRRPQPFLLLSSFACSRRTLQARA